MATRGAHDRPVPGAGAAPHGLDDQHGRRRERWRGTSAAHRSLTGLLSTKQGCAAMSVPPITTTQPQQQPAVVARPGLAHRSGPHIGPGAALAPRLQMQPLAQAGDDQRALRAAHTALDAGAMIRARWRGPGACVRRAQALRAQRAGVACRRDAGGDARSRCGQDQKAYVWAYARGAYDPTPGVVYEPTSRSR